MVQMQIISFRIVIVPNCCIFNSKLQNFLILTFISSSFFLIFNSNIRFFQFYKSCSLNSKLSFYF